MRRNKEIEAFVRLLDVMDELREKCPWDRKQTMETLRPLTIEETYELSDAIMENDEMGIAKELGDILLHIVFYAKIGSEKGTFDIADVMNKLCDKLIYRHPHVFGETQVSNAGDVIENWEKLKTREKDGNKTVLSGVPSSLPSLVKAYRIQDKVRAVGFDWNKKSDVWKKVKEELSEFEHEVDSNSGSAKVEQEFGDLLFSLVNASRLYGELTFRNSVGALGCPAILDLNCIGYVPFTIVIQTRDEVGNRHAKHGPDRVVFGWL